MRFPFLLVIIISVVSAFQSACKKDVVQTLHSDTTITGNTPPNYTGVPRIDVQLYVNKLYVDLLGREPSAAELQANTNTLIAQNLSDAARQTIIQSLMTDSLFYRRMFELTSSDFVNGNGQQQIADEVNQLAYVEMLDSLNGNTQNLFYYHYERDRLNNLQHDANDLQGNAINLNEFYRRFLDNYFFDQINMGTENFVKGSFTDLFRRSATSEELTNAETMVNGQPATLLLTDGSSKGDFQNIVTHADAFYEGLARKYYLQFLLREPTTEEIGEAITLVKPNNDYKALQLLLLKSKAYAGF